MDENILYVTDAEWRKLLELLDREPSPLPRLTALLREHGPFLKEND